MQGKYNLAVYFSERVSKLIAIENKKVWEIQYYTEDVLMQMCDEASKIPCQCISLITVALLYEAGNREEM